MAVLLGCAGCATDRTRPSEGPADVSLTPRLSIKVPRHLAYLPPADGLKLMSALGERPGAEVLGVIVTRSEPTPRMMIIFAKARDSRGMPELDFVGWDEVPEIGALINEMLLAQERR